MGQLRLGLVEIIHVKDGQVVEGWWEDGGEVGSDGGFAGGGEATESDHEGRRRHGVLILVGCSRPPELCTTELNLT